ncbi:TetR/AcrR family transcriptional regulator [Flexivirga sp.]|uniref:TetR/AcrR family transcriptional regulator n=1 Tax=Flexivirga sp. TaxID=1962927 RepID=UPI003F7FCF75
MRTAPVRDRLLDAADEVLFMDGSVSTPVDVILRRAGASPPSLYSHFGNKEGLVTAALQRRLQVWTRVWDEQISRATTDAQRLLALWPALRVYQRDHLTERWCAFSGAAAAIPHPSERLTAVLAEETQLLRDRLLEHSRPIAGRRARSLASALFIAYTGTMATMLREEYHVAIDEGEACARALLAGYPTAL